MIGFYDTVSARGSIRIDDIDRIDEAQDNEHGVPLHRVHLRDGRSFTTFTWDRGGLLRRPVQLIPAQHETHIIRTDGESAWKTPVCAWALCLDGEVRPVTPNGVCDGGSGDTYVAMPCGRIEAVGEYVEPPGFDDAEAMIAHFRRKEKAGDDDRP